MVERRPEMMDYLSGQYREPKGDRAASLVLKFLRENIQLFITDDWVLAFLKEKGDLGIEIKDVLVGPF
jgi:hypothetical protein